LKIHYALQTCDIAFKQIEKRFCADTKKEVIRKCMTSFFESVKHAAQFQRTVEHIIVIFDDGSTEDTVSFLQGCAERYTKENVSVEFVSIEARSVMGSIRTCYEWLLENGEDLVYQVQDDYLFEESAIAECIDIFFKLHNELDTQAIVTPYNAPYLWSMVYKNQTTPRTIFMGSNRYWIQIYDISCSFLTSHKNFVAHKDFLYKFLEMNPRDPDLEKVSLNRILVERGVLGICPFESIALHMQGDYEKDPYVDWKKLWDSIEEQP
jgi:glycosyltransferase involved in cell wall biosynthesis